MRTCNQCFVGFIVLAAGLAVALASCQSAGSTALQASEPAGLQGSEAEAGTDDDLAGDHEPTREALSWQQPIEVATGDAQRGPWRMNESQFHYVDDPTIAMSDDGRVGVAWVDNRRQDIFFQMYDEAGDALLDEPVNVSNSPRIFSWLPRMVINATNSREVFVLWEEIVFSGGSHGGEIFFARSSDSGASFSEPLNLSNTTAGAGKGRLSEERWDNGSLDLVRGPGGELYAAWTEYEGALRFSRSTNEGQHFSDPLRIDGSPTQPARGPSLAVGPEGTIYLAWTIGEQAGADVLLARSSDRGLSFDTPEIAYETDGHADAPKLLADARGGLHLVFGESPGGHFGQYHVRYSRFSHQSGLFEPSKVISDPWEDSDTGAHYPSIGVDEAHNIFVVWEHYPDHRERPRALAIAWSGDQGQNFSTPALIAGSDSAPGFNGSLQGLLMRKLAVNRAGVLGVVNSSFVENEHSRVRLIRGHARR
ncbi:MAG: exo-alpha-sialidase [Bradymonadaceae bacterium]|nr:exo-alpha-sialidase [Lujinxingiaceae bacterium]